MGPPSIGLVPHVAGLPVGLGLVVLLAVAMVLLSRTVGGGAAGAQGEAAPGPAVAQAAEDLG